jgi:hypothetical protein
VAVFVFVVGTTPTKKWIECFTPSYELDPFLKQMALSTLLFVLLFGVGFLLAA